MRERARQVWLRGIPVLIDIANGDDQVAASAAIQQLLTGAEWCAANPDSHLAPILAQRLRL